MNWNSFYIAVQKKTLDSKASLFVAFQREIVFPEIRANKK